MTTAQRFRRVLFWALTGGALARLYVLGEARGWALVGPVALRITGLTLLAWFGHLLLHEGGHLVAARLMRFQLDSVAIGPLEWSQRHRTWTWAGLSLGGRISTLPVGAEDLRHRLRVVAAAGPLVTLVTLAALAVAWVLRAEPITSPLGIFLVAGGLVVVSAATPGRFRVSTAIAGNDVDQMLGGRRVVAHWTYLAVVQAVLAGRRPGEATEGLDLRVLLPPAGAPPEPITLITAVHHLERGEFTEAKALLEPASRLVEAAPGWVHTDVFHQLGAIAALVDGELEKAVRCLEIVRKKQSLPWYGDLLEACIAKAGGDDEIATRRLGHWLDEAKAVSGGRLAFGGNEWILERLDPAWRSR